MKVPLSFVVLFTSCMSGNTHHNNLADPPSHTIWNDLLQKHVLESGLVDYQGFHKDQIQLSGYLEKLQQSAPDPSSWSQKEQLAYWINAYNAFTVQLVLNHLPVESIKDIGSSIQIPFINTPWDIKFIEIDNEKMDLNHIEHSILRKKFREPRIHFAINCASMSCPKLRNEAYTADRLETQLQEQTKEFINDSSKNMIESDRISISKIFKWFKGDFTDGGSLIDFLNQFANITISNDADIGHLDYDWNLNAIEPEKDK